jgi:hypothetical protein
MFLDMVGYSAHMSKNEAHAMKRVKDLEAILHREVPEYSGKVIKFLGDGSMSEFPTAIAAVTCSQAILQAISERNEGEEQSGRFEVRIGLHLGDLIEKDNDLFGDTVNIAARIQPFADRGGIAMSGHVYMSVRNQLTLKGAYLGYTRLKNIPERVRIFLVPPPDTSYLRWLVKRRNPVNTRLRAVTLAIALVAAWAGIAYMKAPRAPQIALLYVTPVTRKEPARTKAQLIADQVAEEMDSRGSWIKGFRWKDRSWVANLVAGEGVVDRTNTELVDVAIAPIARKGNLSYYITGRIEGVGLWSWLLKVRVVDGSTQSVVASYKVQADNAPDVAAGIMKELAVWAQQQMRAERPKAKRR